jgi:hypothetical protein
MAMRAMAMPAFDVRGVSHFGDQKPGFSEKPGFFDGRRLPA